MYLSLKLLIALALFVRRIASSDRTDSSKKTEAEFFPYESIQLTTDAAILSKRPTFAFGHGFGSYPMKTCKSFPGDAEWPTQSAWNAFNASINSALIRTVPIAAPCYDTKWGPKDTARCNEIVGKFTNSFLHESGRACMPKNNTAASDTCTLGGYPEHAVNISTMAQLQLTVNFARNLNMRLVIKNTRHCYLGKSSGAGSLSVWLHNLKDIQFLRDSEGKGAAFKAAAGVTVLDMYQAAETYGVSVQGGICPSVGYVGGYLQGGGHSPLSGYYGMAADSVLAYQVVTADGRFITASETSHPDIFWALRGGGGGTFGVVASAIVKAHPKISVTHSTFVLGNTTDAIVSHENFWKGIRKYWESFPMYTDAGTYSFFIISNVDGQLQLFMVSFFSPGHTPSSFQNLTQPRFNTIRDFGIPFLKLQNTMYYESFYPAYMDAWGNNNWRLGTATSLPGNRLIARLHVTNPPKLNATFALLRQHVESGKHLVGHHQAPQNPQNVDNGVSSAWRNTQAFIVTSSPEFPPDAPPQKIQTARDLLQNDILELWRRLAPASQGGGSYLNEAFVDEPMRKEDFYGEQYSRLLAIKKRYDPTGVFYATTGVGSDGWEVQDGEQGVTTQNGRLCKVRI
ncbi:hypothetical protein BCR34DRAFT_622478 [Clohesyomyces aquaticus]|uniref:FAD-binding PCMH-type domain-containing protein n=1 Tax=Clohesyomyces aquaticus TaxID=1231657 RepID=A0A1Y2A233_9PLEO|nr:hypothetical protein BCR34DRAFT_622478 [Clohesyomyces aquaticus]